MDKRSGMRVIYYNVRDNGQVWLPMAAPKTKFDNLPRAIPEAAERGNRPWMTNCRHRSAR
ncbi:hypothetical protein [Chitiniphilus eburneus]|uniref:hypothetical protein n=1 Tax=Chitiniphilus eburneus TaxID=2571148 RepID=UPI001B7FC27C|nr:hypothetical protein [Chitiniphilus eburneus]